MAWLTGWTYRKPVTLSRATGAVTNYQMLLWVRESESVDSEPEFFSPSNMTSASVPTPYVVDGAATYTQFVPYKAFDGGNQWAAPPNGKYVLFTATSGWVSLDIGEGSSKILTTYSLQMNDQNEATRAPSAWTMLGSNNETDWDTLDTVTAQTGWTNSQTRSFTCDVTTTAYRYFKLNITANNGDESYTQLGELRLYSSLTGAIASGCKSDFSDIRFTNAAGDLLDYYIEEVSGTTPNQAAKIWVEFDSIGTGDTTFYMYYGNADATAVSSGVDTFIAFDDFEWGNDEDNIDTSGGGITWSKTVDGSSTAKIDTAQSFSGTCSLRLHHDGTNIPEAYFTKTAGTDYAIRYRWRKDDISQPVLYHGDGSKYLAAGVEGNEDIHANLGDTGVNASINIWQLYEITDIVWGASGRFDLSFEGSTIADNAGLIGSVGAVNIILFNNKAGTSDFWMDNVIVRQWLSTEPAWGSWGAQETSSRTWSPFPFPRLS